MRGRPHGLGEVADIESPRFERPLRLHGKRRHPGGKRCHGDPEQHTRPAHDAAIVRSSRSSHCAPSTASLARRHVRRSAGSTDPAREIRIGGKTPHGRGEGSRIPCRHEQRVHAVAQQLAGAGRIGCDERRTAREGLERLVRNHARSLLARAEDAERAARGVDLGGKILVLDPWQRRDVRRPAGQERLELPASDDPKRDLRCERGSGEDRLEAVQGDELADEERVERRLRLPPWAGRACPPRRPGRPRRRPRSTRTGRGRTAPEPPCRRPRDWLRRNARSSTRRTTLAPARAWPEARAVVDKGVGERDERVEDHRPATRDMHRCTQVEVTGIADDQHVCVPAVVARAAKTQFGTAQPQEVAWPGGPVVALSPRRRGSPLARRRPPRAAPR